MMNKQNTHVTDRPSLSLHLSYKMVVVIDLRVCIDMGNLWSNLNKGLLLDIYA